MTALCLLRACFHASRPPSSTALCFFHSGSALAILLRVSDNALKADGLLLARAAWRVPRPFLAAHSASSSLKSLSACSESSFNSCSPLSARHHMVLWLGSVRLSLTSLSARQLKDCQM